MTTKSRIDAAKEAMQSQGLSLRKASERYGVPKSTLYYHLSSGMKCGAGRPTVLTEEEEKSIARSCQELQ